VVLKTASPDETSRGTGVRLGIDEREIRFYRELLLEDAAPAVQGDQIAGCTVVEARVAVHALARLHAPVFGNPELSVTPWLNQPNPLGQAVMAPLLGIFLERYGDRVSPEHQDVCRRFVASLDDLQLEVDPLAFGPLRLEFPRAMCNVRDRDGRSGIAWVEWNRNRSLT
jgi:hypothetical protein